MCAVTLERARPPTAHDLDRQTSLAAPFGCLDERTDRRLDGAPLLDGIRDAGAMAFPPHQPDVAEPG
jgi:hypothetical protein